MRRRYGGYEEYRYSQSTLHKSCLVLWAIKLVTLGFYISNEPISFCSQLPNATLYLTDNL